jgi:hypothetical protein
MNERENTMTTKSNKNTGNVDSGICINPPPADERCNCCGRHINELVPYGKAGDPLIGDFDGEFLVKRYRVMGPFDKEAELAAQKVEDLMWKAGQTDGDPLEWFVKIYGEELGKEYYYSNMATSQIESSWECRDCAMLDQNKYIDRRYKRFV